MAKKVEVTVTDDLDGSENAEAVSFGFAGVNYDVDLGKKNRAKLEKALAPYIEVARRAPSASRRTSARSSVVRSDRAAIRVWAKEQGLKLSERGRISAEVVAKYEAAH
jgi:Lsr2